MVDNNKSKNDDEGISSTEKMILENPVYAKLMPERVKKIKRKTKSCKNQIQEFAPEYMKKSAFSNSEKKKLAAVSLIVSTVLDCFWSKMTGFVRK